MRTALALRRSIYRGDVARHTDRSLGLTAVENAIDDVRKNWKSVAIVFAWKDPPGAASSIEFNQEQVFE